MNFILTYSDDNDGINYDEWLEEDPHKLRIIQNTTDFTNEQIKYIMTFVNPLLGSKIDPYLETPLDIVVRVLYESERDNEFGDDNCLGNYYPSEGYLNKDGLPIFEKPRISIIIPKAEDDIKFPLYSDTELIKYCDSKGVKLQMRLIKRLQQLTLTSKGYKGYLYHLWLSRTEYLVYIIAHELRHHWQHIVGFKKEDRTPDSYWYKRTTVVSKISICTGRGSKNENIKAEMDAETYAISQVRKWRRLHSPKDAYPDTSFLM